MRVSSFEFPFARCTPTGKCDNASAFPASSRVMIGRSGWICACALVPLAAPTSLVLCLHVAPHDEQHGRHGTVAMSQHPAAGSRVAAVGKLTIVRCLVESRECRSSPHAQHPRHNSICQERWLFLDSGFDTARRSPPRWRAGTMTSPAHCYECLRSLQRTGMSKRSRTCDVRCVFAEMSCLRVVHAARARVREGLCESVYSSVLNAALRRRGIRS